MKIDPVSFLLDENFTIDKKAYFISGNEKTLIQKIKAKIVEKYQKKTGARITSIDTINAYLDIALLYPIPDMVSLITKQHTNHTNWYKLQFTCFVCYKI